MVKQSVLIGIVIGAFVAGIGIGYGIAQPNQPNFMPMTTQQMQQMMNNPDTMANWMNSMMNDPQLRQQMYDMMLQNSQFMQGMMNNQQFQQQWMMPMMGQTP
ncbi:MAG: hypothetical protein ACT4OW_07300 [Nitrososphaerota archaeon]